MHIKIGKNEKMLLDCLLLSVICVFFNLTFDCLLLDLSALFLFILMMLIIFLYLPELIIKYLSFVITSTWTVMAVFILENGNAIIVGNMTSEHSGALPPYIFSWVLFYCSLIIFEKNGKKIVHNSQILQVEKLPSIFIYGALGLAVICFALVIRYPSFALGVNRFAYRDSVQSSISRNLYKYVIPLTPIMVLNRKNYKKECIGFILALLAYNLWIGEKYGGFFQILFLGILGFLQNGQSVKLKKHFRKVVISSGVILASLLGVVYFQRMVVNPSEDYVSYLSERIASQGLTWWATYKGNKNKGWHVEEVGDELSVMIHNPEGEWINYNHGIYKQMKLFQNSAKVKSMLKARVRAAESTRATFFYYLKYLGIIICQVGGAYVVYKLINNILWAINRGKLFLSYFCALLFRYFYQAFEQSDFYLMTTTTAFLCYLAILYLKHFKIGKRKCPMIATIE